MEENHDDPDKVVDAVAQLVKQISAAELMSASFTKESFDLSPTSPPDRDFSQRIPSSHSPASNRSKSPIFSTKFRQGMLQTAQHHKAVKMNGDF